MIRTAAPQLEPAAAGNMLHYGPFRYRYASGRQGDAYVVGLASQKQYVSLYLCSTVDRAYLAEANAARLGKVSVGKTACASRRSRTSTSTWWPSWSAPRRRARPQPPTASRSATSCRRSIGWTMATRTWPAPPGP